jgi:hypothetical protein
MVVRIWVCRTIRKGSSDSVTDFDPNPGLFLFPMKTLKNLKMKIFILMLFQNAPYNIFCFMYPGLNQLHGSELPVIKHC